LLRCLNRYGRLHNRGKEVGESRKSGEQLHPSIAYVPATSLHLLPVEKATNSFSTNREKQPTHLLLVMKATNSSPTSRESSQYHPPTPHPQQQHGH
jgi:hypothetical protein